VRVLTSAVLVMQAIVLGLAIPAALVVGGRSAGFGWLLAALALAALMLPGAAGRRWYVAAGWFLQGAVLLAGAYDLVAGGGSDGLPMLLVLAVIFAGLWACALRLGTKVSLSPGTVEPGDDPA
jgi:hypothetical protein